MELLFTKGIKGFIRDGRIILNLLDTQVGTEYEYTYSGLSALQNDYNILFLGFIESSNMDMKNDSDYNFIVIREGEFYNISSQFYNFDSKLIELEDIITLKLFPNQKEYNAKSYLVPIFITSEGIEPNYFMSRDEFQRALQSSELCKLLDKQFQNRLIYMYDLISMIEDIKNYIFYLHNNLFEAEIELNNLAVGVYKTFRQNELLKREESVFRGYHGQIIGSLFMTTIIQLCSSLDILTKLICEIVNFPTNFDNPVRFKSGDLYFKNIGRFESVFTRFNGFENSIIKNRKQYENIILTRNLLVHNCYFSSSPLVFIGYGTEAVNNQNIYYATMHIWDEEADGKPSRWLNRCRFYSQNRQLDDYIVGYLIKFYEEFNNTLDLMIQYLNRC